MNTYFFIEILFAIFIVILYIDINIFINYIFKESILMAKYIDIQKIFIKAYLLSCK